MTTTAGAGAATLNGRYGVFVYQDIIVFKKWDD